MSFLGLEGGRRDWRWVLTMSRRRGSGATGMEALAVGRVNSMDEGGHGGQWW